MPKPLEANTIGKIIITIIVIYELVAYLILKDYGCSGLCCNIFTRNICEKSYRFIILMWTPGIVASLIYMWKSELCRTISRQIEKQKQKKQAKQTRIELIKQFFIHSLEQLNKPINADNLTHLEQVILKEDKNPEFIKSFSHWLNRNNFDIMEVMEILNQMINDYSEKFPHFWIDDED